MDYGFDFTKGLSGEWFFYHFSSIAFFCFGQKVQDTSSGEYYKLEDLRSLQKEGEFRLSDGKLIEVKTDCNCYKTNNIVVEMSGRNGDVGWFQHCDQNNVTYVCWILYRKDKNGKQKMLPYRTLLMDFLPLKCLVEDKMSDPEYVKKYLRTKTDYDGSQFNILLLNEKEVYDRCGVKQTITCPNACKVEFPDFSTLYFTGEPTFDPPEEIRKVMRETKEMGLRIGSPIIEFVPDDDEDFDAEEFSRKIIQ